MGDYRDLLQEWFLNLNGEEKGIVDDVFYRTVGGCVCDDGGSLWGTAWIQGWDYMVELFGMLDGCFEGVTEQEKLDASGWYDLEPWIRLVMEDDEGIVLGRQRGGGAWYWKYIPCLLWMSEILGYGHDIRGIFNVQRLCDVS